MKQKLMAILLALLLFWGMAGCGVGNDPQTSESDGTTSADNDTEKLAVQLGAPSSYQATYTSDTGISVISVDAEVIVPDVSSVDIAEAVPRAFTDE